LSGNADIRAKNAIAPEDSAPKMNLNSENNITQPEMAIVTMPG